MLIAAFFGERISCGPLMILTELRLALLRAQRVLASLSETPIDQAAVLRWYGAYLAMAIRRQRDTGKASLSLAATLLDMANHSAAARSFAGEFVDVLQLRSDRRILEQASADIAAFATHACAHATELQVAPLSFDVLHSAVITFTSMLQRYSALLMGVTLMDRGEELLPTWLAGPRFENIRPTIEELATGEAFQAYL